MNIPRVLLAAPKSGSGKTLLTCALLGALKKNSKDVMAYKCGPDYIDPMFHRTVQGIPCENLDSFFTGDQGVKDFLAETANGREIAVIEGVMGLFDGMNVSDDKGSAYDIARLTGTPVVLIIDAHGMSRSLIPHIKGFLDFDWEGLIKGVILNRITPMFYKMISPVLEKELDVPVIGYFPKRDDLNLESRHLGLKLPEEVEGLKDQLEAAADQFIQTAGLEKILEIAEKAEEIKPSCGPEMPEISEKTAEGITVAVARDEAFCFYYGANIRMFESLGAKIKYFSPLHDKGLPEGADALLFGGGYPELYAKELSENVSMRMSVKAAIGRGVHSLAECGGFMYLHEKMKDIEGKEYDMVGAVKGSCENAGKLVRFGYVEIEEKEPLFMGPGETIKAHEFHYYDSTDNGSCCIAKKPSGSRSWECVHENFRHFWGFAHLYYPSNPNFVINFFKDIKNNK